MELNYAALAEEIEGGTLRASLERELTAGFERMHTEGERLPPASYLAARIAEIVARENKSELTKEQSFWLYQEIAIACENARRNVLGEENEPPQA
jgi:hypothetical protein